MTLMHVALADVPNEDAGIAAGLVNVSLEIGSAVGVAVLEPSPPPTHAR